MSAQDESKPRRSKPQLAVMTCRVPGGGAELAQQAHSPPGMFRLRTSAPASPLAGQGASGPRCKDRQAQRCDLLPVAGHLAPCRGMKPAFPMCVISNVAMFSWPRRQQKEMSGLQVRLAHAHVHEHKEKEKVLISR